MLGHASLETTQIYTRVSIQKLKAVHALAHPAHLDKPAAATPAPALVDENEARADLLAHLDEERDDDDVEAKED